VQFDLYGTGQPVQTGWVDASDGLLVRDLNGDGVIDNGGELFGEGTVLADGSKAHNGFEALAALDGNSDGVIDGSDAGYAQLLVWQDLDSDGQSDAGELKSLSDLHITSLSVGHEADGTLDNGNLIGLMGSYTMADGSTRQLGDVWFSVGADGHKVFDLSSLANSSIGHGGLSRIDMNGGSADALKVTLDDVMALGETDIETGIAKMVIDGQSSDTVMLGQHGSAGWSQAGTAEHNGEHYTVYANDHAQLLVNDKIHTVII
jgi:hypothetical protein